MAPEIGEPVAEQRNPLLMSDQEKADANNGATTPVVRVGQVVPVEPRVPPVTLELDDDEKAKRLADLAANQKLVDAATQAAADSSAALEASKRQPM